MIIVSLIDALATLFWIAITARVLISLFGINQNSPIMQILYMITEPILSPIRSRLPSTGMIDFSPIVALIIIIIIQRVARTLFV